MADSTNFLEQKEWFNTFYKLNKFIELYDRIPTENDTNYLLQELYMWIVKQDNDYNLNSLECKNIMKHNKVVRLAWEKFSLNSIYIYNWKNKKLLNESTQNTIYNEYKLFEPSLYLQNNETWIKPTNIECFVHVLHNHRVKNTIIGILLDNELIFRQLKYDKKNTEVANAVYDLIENKLLDNSKCTINTKSSRIFYLNPYKNKKIKINHIGIDSEAPFLLVSPVLFELQEKTRKYSKLQLNNLNHD